MTPTSSTDSSKGLIPKLKSKVDLRRVQITPEEAFLLSRIDGVTELDLLLKSSGLPESRAKELMDKLIALNLVECTRDTNPPKVKHPGAHTAVPTPGGAPQAIDQILVGLASTEINPFDTDELEEPVDLDDETKKRILTIFGELDLMSHYELLGVDRKADAKTIKRGYFQVSKDFHPDAFFRKNLGSYQAKIETIFKTINHAYEVLSDEMHRAEYDHELPPDPSFDGLEERENQRKRQARDGQLKEERRQRLLQKSGVGQQIEKAKAVFAEGLELQKKEDIVGASNKMRLAASLDPYNEEYKKAAKEVGTKADFLRSERDYKEGRYHENLGVTDKALLAYAHAIEKFPGDPRPLYRAACILLKMKKDLKKALIFCRSAQKLDSDNLEIQRTLADIYRVMGMAHNALREYNRCLEMNPTDESVVEIIADLERQAD